MPHQINLYHPVLLAPRQHFHSRTMGQALGLWTLALAALAGWTTWRTHALAAEAEAAVARGAAERQQIARAEAARLAAAGGPAALQQELDRLGARVAERRRLLDDLGGERPETPTTLLAELAESLPAPVWLSEIRWAPGRIELAGFTIEPEALRRWLDTLGATHPLTQVRVDRPEAGAGSAGATPVAARSTWTFRVKSGAPAASGASR